VPRRAVVSVTTDAGGAGERPAPPEKEKQRGEANKQ